MATIDTSTIDTEAYNKYIVFESDEDTDYITVAVSDTLDIAIQNMMNRLIVNYNVQLVESDNLVYTGTLTLNGYLPVNVLLWFTFNDQDDDTYRQQEIGIALLGGDT